MNKTSRNKQSVVVMGGGTGIFPVVSAVKKLGFDVTTIVATSDSGGSTGRIRDEFGFPPVGDLRQSLAALADDAAAAEIRSLLLYRFEKGSGLKGHNLGNLILTALQDITGSTTAALAEAARIFRIDGRVIPVTEAVVQLKIKYADGTEVVGEHILDEPTETPKSIAAVSLTPDCKLNPTAREAIARANYCIIGPGDLYASLLAVLVTPGLAAAMQDSNAPVLYICNLMTRFSQTANMTAQNHLAKIESAIGKKVDTILIHKGEIPQAVLQTYAALHEYPVVDDLSDDSRVVRADLLRHTTVTQADVDIVQRSLLRHSTKKLQTIISKILA